VRHLLIPRFVEQISLPQLQIFNRRPAKRLRFLSGPISRQTIAFLSHPTRRRAISEPASMADIEKRSLVSCVVWCECLCWNSLHEQGRWTHSNRISAWFRGKKSSGWTRRRWIMRPGSWPANALYSDWLRFTSLLRPRYILRIPHQPHQSKEIQGRLMTMQHNWMKSGNTSRQYLSQ